MRTTLLSAMEGTAGIVAALVVSYMFVTKQLTLVEFMVIFWLIVLNIQVSTIKNRR